MKETPNQLNPNSLLLPLKPKVLFVDWHGVMSKTLFWHNKSANLNHYINKKTDEVKSSLFSDVSLVEEWLRGEKKYSELIHFHTPNSSDKTRLIIKNRLLNYFDDLETNLPLLKTLIAFQDKAFIVLATDNMDCFYEALPNYQYLGLFDSVLSSNFLGTLKKQRPEVFFGQWLESHDLNFGDALLIDDSIDNCNRFAQKGGSYFHYSDDESNKKLFKFLENWLN